MFPDLPMGFLFWSLSGRGAGIPVEGMLQELQGGAARRASDVVRRVVLRTCMRTDRRVLIQ